MAADDEKQKGEFVASVLAVPISDAWSQQTVISGEAHRLDDPQDDPLPMLRPVPPMPVFVGATGAGARVTEAVKSPAPEQQALVSSLPIGVRAAKPVSAPGLAVVQHLPIQSDAMAPPIKGWVSLDPDLVLRGWAINVGAPEEKLDVSLYIDDELVASSVAEDFRTDLPGDDKCHGFKFIIPTRFVDSIEHHWVVRAGAHGFNLSSNAAAFAFGPDAIPVISIQRISPDTLSGTIECASLVKCGNPNVWIGSVPLEVFADTRVWSVGGRQGRYPFDIPLNTEQFIEILGCGLRISIPGDRSGARAYEFSPPIVWEVHKDYLQISAGSPFDFTGNIIMPVAVAPIGGESTVWDQVCFSTTGVAEFKIPNTLIDGGFEVVLGSASADSAGPFARFQVAGGLRSVVENWDFGKWREGGPPAGWEVSTGVRVERRFASASRTGLLGVAEDTALLWLNEIQSGNQTLLRQTFGKAVKQPAFVGLVARAAQKCKLRVVALADDASIIAEQIISLSRNWQRIVVETPTSEGAIRALELRLAPEGGLWVELGGLDIAADPGLLFFNAEGASSVEILSNPTCQEWAAATYPVKCTTRTELAKGWWGTASKGTELVAYPVPVQVLQHGANPAHFALSVSTNSTSKYARIEASIQARAFQPRCVYSLTFNASAASPVDGSPIPRHRKWPIVDRIFVMARDPATGVGRFLFDCSRRTPLPAARTRIDVRFEVAESVLDAICESQDEFFLVFEFHSAFQVTLDSFSIDRVAGLVRQAAIPIALEDGDITAQAGATKGCEHWLSPTACKWGGDAQVIAPSAVEPIRWSWSYRDLGTVEVVICVYNAIDETLQCLQSLTQSTSVPHTVSIIDDGSNPNGVERLKSFICDKPWMRIHTNETNKGYTRSADFGIRSAGSDWVVLLNSDTVVSSGWLEGLLEVAASDPDVSLVGPVSNAASFQSVPELYDAAGQWAANEIPAGMSIADMARLVEQVSIKAFPRVPLLNGFCTLIRRSVFVDIGGLDATAFPMGYGEENDMCLRARDAGHVLAVADHVYVHHIKSASFGKAKRSELSKAGNQRLREKHPTTDFARLGREFGDIAALATLRQRVRDALRERQARAGSVS